MSTIENGNSDINIECCGCNCFDCNTTCCGNDCNYLDAAHCESQVDCNCNCLYFEDKKSERKRFIYFENEKVYLEHEEELAAYYKRKRKSIKK